MNAKRFDVLSILLYSLISFVLLIGVLHFALGFQYAVVLTDSMEPHINPNDLVVIAPVHGGDVRTGEVVMYQVAVGGSTYRIIHRVVEVGRDSKGIYYITKGDNREYTDPWRVRPSWIIGKVVLVVPKVGVVWYYTPLIVLGAFLFIIGSLAYDIAMVVLNEPPLRSKAMKPSLLAVRRKKVKVHHHRR